MTISDNADIKAVQEINMPDGVVAVNVFYFKADFDSTQQDDDVIGEIESWIETLYTTIIDAVSDLVTLGELTIYVYNATLNQWDNHGTGSPSVTFAEVSEMLPHGVSALVRHYSVEPRTIGRKYLPGFAEGEADDGVWGAVTLTALAAFGAAWGVSIEIDELNILWPGVWTTKALVVYKLSPSYVVLADPAYQRRRRPGSGS